ncbi:MAG TPA: GAF domain-containing protein [Pseudonocardiaceae bacterium]|nr:GAF domain-containing protein [Pseudonocardiaceae bacterium]
MREHEEWEVLLDELRAEFLLREKELELLHAIDLRLLESERPLDETFSFIATGTQELLNSDHTDILLRRGKSLEPVYSSTPFDIRPKVPISESITGQCYSEGIALNVSDLIAQPYLDRYIPIAGYHGEKMRSLLAIPILLHDTTVGVLNSESSRPGAFRHVHVRVATAVAAQIAIAVDRTQIFDRAALFTRVDQLIFEQKDSHHAIQLALERVLDALRDPEQIELTGAQIMFRRGQKDLEIVHSTNPLDIGLVLDVDESISGRAVRERKTVILEDVRKDPDYRMLGTTIQSEIVVPILLGNDNAVIGVLNVESEELNAFGDFHRILLESFADKVRILLAFAKLRADVTDALELRQADDLLVAVGDQTSNMIHRLNNTVGAMRVIIRELQDVGLENGGIQDSSYLTGPLDTLLQLADRTLEMPQQFTQFLSQESSSVDVNGCVETVLIDLQVPDNVTCDIRLGDNIPALSLYCFDLVVQNLLQNSCDAMPNGGRLTVKTSLIFPPDLLIRTGYVQLTISDTGSGIPEDILPHVFELNFTTKREKGKGLGLGLWWVRNFVRRAKGDISISSIMDVGSEVVVKIPVDRSSEDKPPVDSR